MVGLVAEIRLCVNKEALYSACLPRRAWQGSIGGLRDGSARSLVISALTPYATRLLMYDPKSGDDGFFLRCRQDGARYLVCPASRLARWILWSKLNMDHPSSLSDKSEGRFIRDEALFRRLTSILCMRAGSRHRFFLHAP